MRLFDVLGPVMIGPSSSHTAGAARIGYTAQKLLGRVADPGGTRCMAGRGADHNRPENVKQAHPMHILSCSAGQKSPASHFFLSFIIPLLPHLCYNNFINV